MTVQQQAVAIAKEQIGKPYVLGANGPDSYDCKGLVWYSWFHAGLTSFVVCDSYHMAKMGTPVSLDAAYWQDGDLIFPAVPGEAEFGHVQLWDAGAQQVIEAPHTGADVLEQPEWTTDIYAVRRISQAYTGVELFERAEPWPVGCGIEVWQDAIGVPVTCLFDAATTAATKERQAYMGVTADGIVGPLTWAAVFGA